MKPSPVSTKSFGRTRLKALLVGVEFPGKPNSKPKGSLDELTGLAETALYKPVATMVQKLGTINPKTFIGSGKVIELQEAVKHHQVDAVIFDEVLSPAQTRNLEKILECGVVDRAWVILQIFGDHARTRVAKTQVDLARLKYSLPRLTKMWTHLSRQRGGIGMRDVGETQIQLDRRLLRDKITKLERKLKQIHGEKQTQRKSRRGTFQVALVGYTNVGKSTLMNILTGADTLVEDKLFATLDATVRKVKKNFPYPILLADTVGLIDKLPHDLVASFKSTLDEVRDANLLLHVVDISHPDFRSQMETAENLIREIEAHAIDTVLVFNKTDKLKGEDTQKDLERRYPEAVFVSCQEGTGMGALRKAIVENYEKNMIPYKVKLNYNQSGLIPEIRKHALVVKENYEDNFLTLDLRVWPSHTAKLSQILNGRKP